MNAIYFGHETHLKNHYSAKIRSKISTLVNVYEHDIPQENYSECAEHIEAMSNAQVLFTTTAIKLFPKEAIRKMFPKLKILLYLGGSVRYFAQPFIENDVIVISGWGGNAIPVAEFAASQIILANKGFFRINDVYKEKGHRASRAFADNYPSNRFSKVGILGAGMIGKMVIEKLRACDVDIYVFDPFFSDENAKKFGVTKASLEYIFENCNTISNHIANLPQTVGILSEKLFCSMLPYAFFINTARGAQVDHDGLYKAMRDVPTRTTMLDVTDPEPLPENHPLISLPNVLFTPHIAGTYKESIPIMINLLIDDLIRFQNSEKLLYNVTAEMLISMA